MAKPVDTHRNALHSQDHRTGASTPNATRAELERFNHHCAQDAGSVRFDPHQSSGGAGQNTTVESPRLVHALARARSRVTSVWPAASAWPAIITSGAPGDWPIRWSSARISADRRAESRSNDSRGICRSRISILARSDRDFVNSTPERTSKTATVLSTGTSPLLSSRSISDSVRRSLRRRSTRTLVSSVTPMEVAPVRREPGLFRPSLPVSHERDCLPNLRRVASSESAGENPERGAGCLEDAIHRGRETLSGPLCGPKSVVGRGLQRDRPTHHLSTHL